MYNFFCYIRIYCINYDCYENYLNIFLIGMLAVWDRRSEFQIIESVQFYFNKIDTIKMPDYIPNKVRN